MRKILFFTMFVLMFAFTSVGSLALGSVESEDLIDIDVSECYLLATNFVKDFYEARCSDMFFSTSTQVKDSNLQSIILDKIRLLQVSDIANIDSYDIDISLGDSLIEEDLIYIKLIVKFSYSYVGDSSVFSNSKVEFFLFEKEGLRQYNLLYWLDASNPMTSLDNILYCMEDFYTSSIKGFKTWLSKFSGYESYVDSIKEYVDSQEIYYNNTFTVPKSERIVREVSTTLNNFEVEIPGFSYGLYNLESTSSYELLWTDLMASYAISECDEVYPQSGSSEISYFDFYMEDSDGNADSWDCTNFISHCLSAGGAEMYEGYYLGDIINGWWCSDASVVEVEGVGSYSAPWTNVAPLYNYLTRSASTPGPFANGNSSFYYGDTFSIGDIIQQDHDSDGWWDHSLIIVGSRSVSGYSDPIPVVASRSSPYTGTYGILPSNQTHRILRLIGYRLNP